MRILAVAHVLHLGKIEIDLRRERALRAVRIDRGEIVADRGIISGSVRERLFRQIETCRVTHRAAVGLHLGQNVRVVRWVGDDGDMAVVLRRGAHHGRAADVDIFNGIFQRAIWFCDSRRKRIQIHHHQIDGRDIVFL